jgi:hypothetical protein
MSKPLKVSVISKEVHAKPLYAWLVDNGFDVAMLGDNPTTVPSSTDVVVCRIRSCSHQASHLAAQWTKKTGTPLIMENGLKTITKKLEDLRSGPDRIRESPVFELDTVHLDLLLERASGKTMSWLARCLHTDTEELLPALMEKGLLASVSATLNQPATEVVEEEIPERISLGDLRVYAAIILSDRKTDPFEVQLQALRVLAEETQSDEVLRQLLGEVGEEAIEEAIEEVVEEVVEEPPTFEGLPPEESPMGGFHVLIPDPEPPSTLMEAFEALRLEVVALRGELQDMKTPRGSVTLDDLISAGASITITPKDV